MAKGDDPDYIVKLPVGGVWHRLGAAWKSKKEGKDSITVVLDVGAALTFQPGAKLVLTELSEIAGVGRSLVYPAIFFVIGWQDGLAKHGPTFLASHAGVNTVRILDRLIYLYSYHATCYHASC